MSRKLIGSAVGLTTHKGQFAAIVHRFKFDDGSELLASWGQSAVAQMIALLTHHANKGELPEPSDADEELFKQNTPEMTRDDVEAPCLASIVSHMTCSIEQGVLNLNLIFRQDNSIQTIAMDPGIPVLILGWTANALQDGGFLDQILKLVDDQVNAPPLLLYSCSIDAVQDINYTEYRAYDIDMYRAMTSLYCVSVAINGPQSKKIVGGFFFKSSMPDNSPQFQIQMTSVFDALPEFSAVDRNQASLLHTRLFVQDGEPLTNEHMLKMITDQYVRYTSAGSA
ncbi:MULTISPECIES: hypothetical protein [Pseudomonas syringae group]|uniref:Uncharacterized protein n=3 Tax=Pseudomonas syringae group TaxID=136849 RepID=A0A267KU48_PSESS|nr:MULTISPECIES: hypothetical protein [Pseudomonas syringae group]KPY17032.1 hypothetical protein ALO54_200212 [Pseudomonas syringae pv. philadelphi]MDT3227988.1 hypothetical protein [Pseudomonas amygdali pv. morsprunorum]MDT3244509.1 hypothetical protein [Pseudomonas amygdali pv. morsprunorum]MDT3264939.1 hypothetical protein [Pseudomonas amygdali pv. morsprunorum]PAB38507.1 hypothetical protein CC205_04425 [Pseudomonas savastanoi pv. nerii]